MSNLKKMTIDGVSVEFDEKKNMTILAAAEQAGIYIPSLCSCEELNIKGNCRVCMVEVWTGGQAVGKLVPACSTPAAEGIVVETASESALTQRRAAVELILANHNRSCPGCDGNRSCSLQKVADGLNIIEEDFSEIFQDRGVETVPGVLKIRRDRCIKCGRCKAYCSQIAGVSAIDSFHRGWETEFHIEFGSEEDRHSGKHGICTLCGGCTQVCPVGCLSLDTHLNRFWDSIDEEEKDTAAVFCLDRKAETELEEKTGYTPNHICGMLLETGVKKVIRLDGSAGDACERAANMAVPGQNLVVITGDVSVKRLVREDMGAKFQAVLTPQDIVLLIKQSILDMDYVKEAEPESV